MNRIENISLKQRSFILSQVIFTVLLSVFVISTIWLMAFNRNWNTLNTWHIFLSTFGISCLMGLSISMLNPGNIFTLGCSKPFAGLIHGILATIASLSLIIGVAIKIQDKTNNNRSHFTSTHGILGLVTFLLTFISLLSGVLVEFAKPLYQRLGLRPVLLKNFHILFGIVTYCLGIATICLGLRNYFSEASYETNTGFIVILVVSSSINLLGPIFSLFKI